MTGRRDASRGRQSRSDLAERGADGSAEDDRALIRRAADGDRAAFGALMARHEDMVFAVCMRMLGDREAALDASQETFITLLRKADRYRGDAAVSTWLYRVTVNTCLDQMRKAKRRRTEPMPEHHDPSDLRAGDPFEAVELRPDVETALAGLPDEFRAAVVLSDLQGLPLAEVAAALDVPVGTVKSRIFRGRRILAGVLGNLREGPRHQTGDEDA